MSDSTIKAEKKLIRISITMGVIYTMVGITWGIIIQSGIILFDAIYSGVSILLSMMTMYALIVVSKDDSFDAKKYQQSGFHMGRTAVEPLVNMVKSLVIISICLYGFVSAVLVVLQGGTQNGDAFSGIYYGVTTAVICLCSWCYLKFFSTSHNDLIQAECEQWMVDAIFSLLVVVSFIINYLMSQVESTQHLAQYVDPVSVIVATVYFIKVPARRLIKSTKELLVMAPDDSIQQEIKQVLQPVVDRYGFQDHIARTSKTGRQLIVEVAFIVGESDRTISIQQLDEIRSEVDSGLKTLCDNLWLTVSFTNEHRWA